MAAEILASRTEAFAKRIVALCLPMLADARTRELARNLLRSGTAANANYVSARRGRTHDEFTFRLGHACEYAAEAKQWIEVLWRASGVEATEEIEALRREAEDLRRVLVCAYQSAQATRKSITR